MKRVRLARIRSFGQIAVILLVTVAIECVFVPTINRFIDARLQEREANLRTEANTAAVVIWDNLKRVLDQIDALHSLARLVTLARQGHDAVMEQTALEELAHWHGNMRDGVRHIGAIKPSGMLDWTTLSLNPPQISLADRDYVHAIVDGSANAYIGAPAVGRISGETGIRLSRAMRAPDGALTAITVVDLDPRMLSALGTLARLSDADTLTILRSDGIVLARSDAEPYAGQRISPESPEMRQFLSAPRGLIPHLRSRDGVDHLAAWQHIDGSHIILVVELDRDAREAAFLPTLTRLHHWIWLTASLIAIVGIGFTAFPQWRRRIVVAEARTEIVRESETLFRQMAESLPDLITLMDQDGTIQYASAAARGLLGVDPETMIGQPANHYVDPDDVGKIPPAAMAPLTPGAATRFEVRLRRPDGKMIWVQTHQRTVGGGVNDDNAVFVSVTRDVTAQREAEMALRQATEELDAMLAATGAVLFRYQIDQEGRFHPLFVSKSAEQLIGYTPAEVTRQSGWFAAHFDPAFEQEHAAHLRRLRAEGSSRTQYRLRHKEGHWLWISMFSRQVEGDGFMVVGAANDVTREHERDVQLAQSAKLAMLGEMSTGMAHELNQPLAAIGMMAENGLLALQANPAAHALVGHRLQRIMEQVKRAAAIVDHMRIFGRKADGAPARVVVADAIDGAASVLGNRLRKAGIDLLMESQPDLPFVIGHLVLLEQVLVNLVANAVDAIETQVPPLPAAGRRIEVAAAVVSEMVQITVTDHAGGIDDDALPRLFEPFFTTKPIGSGTGLGLSISYGIVTDMGGIISARNRGDGAIFTVRLPAA